MTITSTTTEAELRNFANDLYNQLKTTLGDVFDLDEQKKKNEYYVSSNYVEVSWMSALWQDIDLDLPLSAQLFNGYLVGCER